MAKVHLICGKICSGKSYYAKILSECEHAVILSVDEITYSLFNNNLGDDHERMTNLIKSYLFNKSVEIINNGLSVILDWGFWTKEWREYASKVYKDHNIPFTWHYVDISDEDWYKNIAYRNDLVEKGISHDYYLDEGLMHKLLSRFEIPDRSEIDVWYLNKR